MVAKEIALENAQAVLEHTNPDGSRSLQLIIEWQIDPMTARRRAGRLVGDRIGNLLFGGYPSLVLGSRLVWRVPILLAYKG